MPSERESTVDWHTEAQILSNALRTLRPLGGSEMVLRRGDEFIADAHYCGKLIAKMLDDLHELRKENVKLRRAALEAAEKVREGT